MQRDFVNIQICARAEMCILLWFINNAICPLSSPSVALGASEGQACGNFYIEI